MAVTDPRVASVFLDVRRRMDFVPALFRALAGDAETLELAWLQARTLYDDPRSRVSASRLRALAEPDVPYRPSEEVRAAVAPFLAELPSLLLVATSLALALEGSLPTRPAPPARLPEPGPLPETPVAEHPGDHPLYAEIRAVYGTEHVPVMFRALAAHGLLEEPWRALGPYLASEEGSGRVAALAEAACAEAGRFPEVACFAPPQRELAGRVLGQLTRALPRNLVFATAASRA